ncbi:hypothetical protein A0H81_09099 [Grifola frondosa]|uniref:Uncharacterized protein n=1 Tax=Grifola frondosa TaxID=5627 RepID=A0A1C7M1J9_GRIFR|nr:hypothetical protein A0H81_09099 [Grifola frondosa]
MSFSNSANESFTTSSCLNPSCEHSNVTDYQNGTAGDPASYAHHIAPESCATCALGVVVTDHHVREFTVSESLLRAHGVKCALISPWSELSYFRYIIRHLRPNSALRRATAFHLAHFALLAMWHGGVERERAWQWWGPGRES